LQHQFAALLLDLPDEIAGIDSQGLATTLGISGDIDPDPGGGLGGSLQNGLGEFVHRLHHRTPRAYQGLGLLTHHVGDDHVVLDPGLDAAFETECRQQTSQELSHQRLLTRRVEIRSVVIFRLLIAARLGRLVLGRPLRRPLVTPVVAPSPFCRLRGAGLPGTCRRVSALAIGTFAFATPLAITRALGPRLFLGDLHDGILTPEAQEATLGLLDDLDLEPIAGIYSQLAHRRLDGQLHGLCLHFHVGHVSSFSAGLASSWSPAEASWVPPRQAATFPKPRPTAGWDARRS